MGESIRQRPAGLTDFRVAGRLFTYQPVHLDRAPPKRAAGMRAASCVARSGSSVATQVEADDAGSIPHDEFELRPVITIDEDEGCARGAGLEAVGSADAVVGVLRRRMCESDAGVRAMSRAA